MGRWADGQMGRWMIKLVKDEGMERKEAAGLYHFKLSADSSAECSSLQALL
jgi:hypothetical protein